MQATGYNMNATLEDGLLTIEGTNWAGRKALAWDIPDRVKQAEAEAAAEKEATGDTKKWDHIRTALADPTMPIIPVALIDEVTFKNANSMVNGRIVVYVGDKKAQFYFRRKTRDECERFYEELVRQINATPMGMFSRNPTTPAQQGNRQGDVFLTFPRGEDLEIEVVGLEHRQDAVRALVGKRPRDETEREKSVRVRLVREPSNQHDPNAIAVHTDKHGHVGYIPRTNTADLGPAFDQLLAEAGKASSKSGQTVYIYCSADLYAVWPDLEDLESGDDKDEPESVELTLMLSRDLAVKASTR